MGQNAKSEGCFLRGQEGLEPRQGSQMWTEIPAGLIQAPSEGTKWGLEGWLSD